MKAAPLAQPVSYTVGLVDHRDRPTAVVMYDENGKKILEEAIGGDTRGRVVSYLVEPIRRAIICDGVTSISLEPTNTTVDLFDVGTSAESMGRTEPAPLDLLKEIRRCLSEDIRAWNDNVNPQPAE